MCCKTSRLRLRRFGVPADDFQILFPRLARAVKVLTGIGFDIEALQSDRPMEADLAQLPEQRKLIEGALVERADQGHPILATHIGAAGACASQQRLGIEQRSGKIVGGLHLQEVAEVERHTNIVASGGLGDSYGMIKALDVEVDVWI